MKSKIKIFLYLFIIALLALTSCSTDGNTTETVNSILVKKIIYYDNVDDIVTLYYKYNGNKLISESNNINYVANYTYTENVITKIEELVDNKFQNSSEFTYVDGKIATAVYKRNYGGDYYFTYTYNSNGTVSYYSNLGFKGILTLVNGNIVKDERIHNGSSSKSTHTYEYDAKNNPFKNVLGFNLLLDIDELGMFSANNITKHIDSNFLNGTSNYSLKYDANDFPTEKWNPQGSNNSYNLHHSQYFY